MGLEDLCAGGGDCRAERELLRRAAEVEASSQDLIERRRQELVEQRLELEARAQAAEEELEAEKAKEKASVTAQSSAAAASPPAADAKAAALALGAEASRQQSEGRGSAGDLSAVWPELEGATAALRATEAELEEVRARAVGAVEEERRHLEASSAMYRLYASASGIRWGTSDEPEGYVALDSVRHFSTAGLGAQEAADKVWQTIEACLPQREDPAAAGGA
mmetsp:Transcript_47220/g.122473  ORF Transcript_47220/g.122473 Transcript_47220/m.122473 type:complete len:221 (+) Transcript_47220:83-745(+)